MPGQPQSFKLWIKGDGKGAWPTLHLKDAAGSDQLLRGPYVTWTGWRQVTFAVPPGAAMPLSVSRFYLAETAAAKQYTGEIVIDELTAQVPPTVDLPEQAAAADPLIDPAAVTERRDWRFAVMSDAQFVARDPDSAIVTQARRTLREIKAVGPDFLVINGDLVDEGSPADLAFAHRILTEELGDSLPWYYVPGNHEVMGGKIDNFVTEFGPAQRTFDHKGTRFVTLDTSSLSLRGGGFAQIKQLRAQLDAAAKDRTVGSVMLIEHVPPRDPTVQKGSQLADRKEAALVEQWLADFRRTTGKGAAFIGSHVGVFHASHVDGVPYLINGNSGKAPAGPADEGASPAGRWSAPTTSRPVNRRQRGSGRGRAAPTGSPYRPERMSTPWQSRHPRSSAPEAVRESRRPSPRAPAVSRSASRWPRTGPDPRTSTSATGTTPATATRRSSTRPPAPSPRSDRARSRSL